MLFRNIIFDLDGTLTDSRESIFNSLRYALGRLQFDSIPEVLPNAFIGPPLQKSFKELFGFNEKNTELAVGFFREYYGKHGIYEGLPFPGMVELLAQLYEEGAQLFVATSKFEKYAWDIIRHFEMERYFVDLKGSDYKGSYTKALLIEKLMVDYRLEPDDTVMIGDTAFDIIGAKEAGVQSIAVNYGFGEEEKLKSNAPDYFMDDLDALAELLLG